MPIHYGGVASDMDALCDLADRHGLSIVEDAANAFGAQFGERKCGTIGRLGCLSFHVTKVVHCGQGGALLVNDESLAEEAEIILEKGTDRRQFLRNEVDRYSWRGIGGSFALEDLRAAFLLAQLEANRDFIAERRRIARHYHESLQPLADNGAIELPSLSGLQRSNGQIFWIKAKSAQERNALIDFLASKDIHSVFHYVPLHSSQAGKKFGRFAGDDVFTTAEAGRLLRLPIFSSFFEWERVTQAVQDFCAGNSAQKTAY